MARSTARSLRALTDTTSSGTDVAVHAAGNAVAAMLQLGAVPAVARAAIEIDVLHVWEQGPAFAAAFLVFYGGRGMA